MGMPGTKSPKRLRVVVGSAKGGVGKTTVAAHLARLLNAHLYDLDPEHGTRALAEHDLSIRVQAEVPPVRSGERVVLDVPANQANNAGVLKRAAAEATHVLIPCLPGDIEMDRLENTLLLLAGQTQAKIGVILNRAGRDNTTAETLAALEALPALVGVPFTVAGVIPASVRFPRALVNGFQGGTLAAFEEIRTWL